MSTTKREGGESFPPYSHAHSGPVLVCGNAWCLNDDLERARRVYPDAPAIVVNGASGNVRAIALFSLHPDKLSAWIPLQEKRFGPGFTVHGLATKEKALSLQKIMPWVDHWWTGSAKGTSTWAARKLASYMGFDEVILCGMPLIKGPYQGGKMAKYFNQDRNVEVYRNMILNDAPHWRENVKSMSGWTAEQFGAPWR